MSLTNKLAYLLFYLGKKHSGAKYVAFWTELNTWLFEETPAKKNFIVLA